MVIYTGGCCDGDPRPPTGTGRCCLPNGNCVDGITRAACESKRGSFDPGETCFDFVCPDEDGTCCLPGDKCVPSTRIYCDEKGGIFNPNTDCNDQPDPCDLPVNGACCLPDGTCVETTEVICDFFGGTWHNLSCDPVVNPCDDGACCLPDGTCRVTTAINCAAIFGVFHPGLTCTSVPFPCPDVPATNGACCLPDGSCQEFLSPAQCAALDGTFHEGANCVTSPIPCAGLWGSSVPEELLKIQKNNLTKQKSDTDVNNNSTAQQSDTNIKSDNTMQDDQIKNNVINAIESLKQEGVSLNDFDDQEKSAGLGDVVANVLNKFGLTQDYLQKALGFGWGCGCNERKSFLNKIFSFNKKE